MDVTDAFGVTTAQWEQIEGGLFGASLLPYLGFLFYLQRDATDAPRDVNFGFQFLLAFVFGTIPAGVYCKVQLDDILANVDWLHGSAESLLAVTNLVVLLGARRALAEKLQPASTASLAPGGGSADGDGGDRAGAAPAALGMAVLTVAGLAALSVATESTALALNSATHTVATVDGDILLDDLVGTWREVAVYVSTYVEPRNEPANALSLPTWSIHVSSLVEWLASMELIWYYADVGGNPRWKGLTWGMVPCHASGLAACTFHLFFNDPRLASVVATQAALTVVGNATCAIAAYRIWDYAEKERQRAAGAGAEPNDGGVAANPSPPQRRLAPAALRRVREKVLGYSEPLYLFQLAFATVLSSASIKYGSLYLDVLFPDGAGGAGSAPSHVALAFACIFIPTAFNLAKWRRRAETAVEQPM